MRTRTLASWALLSLASCAGSQPAAPPPVAPTSPAAVPAPPPQAAAPSASGIWLGELGAGKRKLRVQLRLDLAATPQVCLADSIDQSAFGLECTNVVANAASISFDVPSVKGHYAGTVSADGKTIDGSWTQANPVPLAFSRQDKALDASSGPRTDPAMAAVALADLQAVLDKDLAGALATGDLAPATEAGVAIGVYSHGTRKVVSYGKVKADAVFEIGSITKTFTGLMLAQMAAQKKVRLDEPVRALLPPGTVAAPASGAEITLLDLSAQRSGLPRMPDNFKPTNPDNPYADYDAKALYSYVAGHGVAMPPKPEFAYSNIGVGLLGQALSDRAALTYEALLRKQIVGPLGMHETAVVLPPAMLARVAPGHDGDHKPAHAWDLTAFAGAGGIRSTAADMLKYLEAQLHPDKLPASVRATTEGKTLPEAILASHAPQEEAGHGMHIALNWFRVDESGTFWHNGGTGGYSSFATFNPEQDFAVIVLCNTAYEDDFADKLGQHVAQRLTGKPAVSLSPPAP